MNMAHFRGHVLSAEDMASIKVAIQICNIRDLKREILYAFDEANKKASAYKRKVQWNERVESKAEMILKNLGLPEKLEEKVMRFVIPIGMRMLTWAEYHEGTLGFSRQYSMDFLKSSFFDHQGIVDNKKAAKTLIIDENLTVGQKYTIACLYCFTDHIRELHRQMTRKDKEVFCNRIHQPGLIKYWSYHLMGKDDEIRGEKLLDQYRLYTAIESGSKSGVEYCFEEARRKEDIIADSAVKAVGEKLKTEYDCSTNDDWLVFRNERYDCSKVSWVPSDYYVDILIFLLSQMDQIQQLEFLKTDIRGDKYKLRLEKQRSRVLEYFLDWPYQNYFMKTVGQIWEFLPEKNYVLLLLRICDKIQFMGEIWSLPFKSGEEKSFDYRELLKEFWYQSPERFKRYVLQNNLVRYGLKDYGTNLKTCNICVALLIKLLNLKKFTNKDRKIIRLILDSATREEKYDDIIFSLEWKGVCFRLIIKEKWEILDRFLLNSFLSKEDADKFIRELIVSSFREEVRHICIDFLEEGKFCAAESLLKRSCLTEEETRKFKTELINSFKGLDACEHVVLYSKKLQLLDKMIRWCIPSEDEAKLFKKAFVFSENGKYICKNLVIENRLEIMEEFVIGDICSEIEIKELKKSVAYRIGASVCEALISHYSEDFPSFLGGKCRYKFEGGKWEEVEKFLTWCFSSEEEINEFKKGELLETAGVAIHFNLIKLKQWREANTFFAWLDLSVEEIKLLKKETLFNSRVCQVFRKLIYSNENEINDNIAGGSKQEEIELLLMWYLTDKVTVLEFKTRFHSWYAKEKALLKCFDLMIDQYLRDLDAEKMTVKRKSETFSPNKAL